MLGTKDAIATVAVRDLDAARKFYEGVVGLQPTPQQEPGAIAYQTGSSTLFVYPSQYAGSNRATAVTWVVGKDLDDIVRDLKAKGVAFEHYDLPETSRNGAIHSAGNLRLAWFKDPDGNIHGLAGG
jgi:catechol 2,3-dioxygenase-like lactoylglutathione lyase family enzyme